MMDPLSATLRVITRPFDFSGRASRSEFWWFSLSYFIAVSLAYRYILWPIFKPLLEEYLATGTVDTSAVVTGGVWYMVINLVGLYLLPCSLAVTCRRLHDTGRSGWWQLLFLVPVIGPPILLILWILPSHGPNRFGGPPRGTKAPPVSRGLQKYMPEKREIDYVDTPDAIRDLRHARMPG